MKPRPVAPRRGLASVLALSILATGCASVQPPATTESRVPAATANAAPADATPPVAVPGPILAERISIAVPSRPVPPVMSASLRFTLVDDHCVDRDLPTPVPSDPAFTILDRSYGLPAAYVPPDLTMASAAGLTGEPGTKLVSSRLVDDLAALRDAWDAAGLQLVLESAYRSYGDQAATFNAWAAQLGHAGALLRSARPGHSEHQLGTALDFTSPGWSGRFGDWAAESDEGAWLAEHGWAYGFVMSYPAGSQAETCFGYEPWHYRWIGREAAAEQRAGGGSLREYLVRRGAG